MIEEKVISNIGLWIGMIKQDLPNHGQVNALSLGRL
jgi:hypothetical protein